jgi:hypothetical protein
MYNYKHEVKAEKIGKSLSTHGEEDEVIQAVVGKPEGNRPLGRPRHRSEYNIKIGLKRNRMGLVWTGLIWLRKGGSEGGSYEHGN